jgi:putative ABC transport system permease protein
MMVLREQLRRPLRTALTLVALASAAAIMVLGHFSADAFDEMMRLQDTWAWREDIALTLHHPVRPAEMAGLLGPDVVALEGYRVVGARVHAGPRTREMALNIVPAQGRLRGIVDVQGRLREVPDGGVMLTSVLADLLEVELGGVVLVEVLEGGRPMIPLRVVGFVEEPFGLNAWVRPEVWWPRVGEEPSWNVVAMKVRPGRADAVHLRLLDLPATAGVLQKARFWARFDEQMGQMMLWMTLILSVGATAIGLGVVYNHARISLAARSRDLASLRVLGFHRGEVARLFYLEMAVQIALAAPLGLWMGREMSAWLATTIPAEIFRFPEVYHPSTALQALAVLVLSAVLSALLLRPRLMNLDMIAALKAHE